MDILQKKAIAEMMLANAQKKVVDDEVGIDFYEFCASLETDEKNKANFLVQADKIKITKQGSEHAVDLLQKFVAQY